ncbi:hypothetical protein MUK42_24921 [Musa troglodytarum]|uniref:Uncharacterized protein n=1 Tax=Musa troglodytarum TaxID=320322 RepID=A0A9E7J994_9LILI|nr:hypothetical protein MUK42_24921 [Musa troglodytarum]
MCSTFVQTIGSLGVKRRIGLSISKLRAPETSWVKKLNQMHDPTWATHLRMESIDGKRLILTQSSATLTRFSGLGCQNMNLHCCRGSLFFPLNSPCLPLVFPKMKPCPLLGFLLLLYLQVMWSVATDIISHGAGDQARQLPQLLEDLPSQGKMRQRSVSSFALRNSSCDELVAGRNVTVKLSVEVDGGERLSHSKKRISGGKGGKGVGGGGSQSLRQPRSGKSSSTSLRRPYGSLWGIGLPSLLLCVALT